MLDRHLITGSVLAGIASLSPLPVYLLLANIFTENVLFLFGLNLIVGAIVGGLSPKHFSAIIFASSVLSAVAIAYLAKGTDSMWIIGCAVAFLATLLQYFLVPLGRSWRSRFAGDKSV